MSFCCSLHLVPSGILPKTSAPPYVVPQLRAILEGKKDIHFPFSRKLSPENSIFYFSCAVNLLLVPSSPAKLVVSVSPVETAHSTLAMQASNESTSRENDSVKHFVPEEEPSRGSLRKHVGGCAPMLVLALLGVSVLAFLVARCALHLKNSRNSTTFLRRLAEEVRCRAFTAHGSSLLKSQTVPRGISIPLSRQKLPCAATIPLKVRRITAQC